MPVSGSDEDAKKCPDGDSGNESLQWNSKRGRNHTGREVEEECNAIK